MCEVVEGEDDDEADSYKLVRGWTHHEEAKW